MKSSQSPRILVVDDDLGVIAAYRYVLEGEQATSANRSADWRHSRKNCSDFRTQS